MRGRPSPEGSLGSRPFLIELRWLPEFFFVDAASKVVPHWNLGVGSARTILRNRHALCDGYARPHLYCIP